MSNPVEQGVLGIVAVFIDTFIVLNITVFTVLSAEIIKFEGGEPAMKGIQLVQEAFSQHLFGHTAGYFFIAVCLFFFAFSTIIGWYYFGETNIRYLFGKKGLRPYQIFVVAFIFLGSLLKIDLVWELVDFFNGIMVIPNLVGLLLLSGTVVAVLRDYNSGKPYDVNNYLKK